MNTAEGAQEAGRAACSRVRSAPAFVASWLRGSVVPAARSLTVASRFGGIMVSWLVLSSVMSFATAAAPSLAQEPRHAPAVTIKTVGTDSLSGQLTGLSLADGAILRAGDGGTVHVPAPDLVRITFEDAAASTAGRKPSARGTDAGATFFLINGDRISGRIVDGDERAVTLQLPQLGALRVPLDFVEMFQPARSDEPAYRDSAVWLERKQRRDADHILLTNGDVMNGVVKAIDAEGLAVSGSFGDARLPHSLVVVARLAPAPSPPLDRPYFVLRLRGGAADPPDTDGNRLTAVGFEYAGEAAASPASRIEARLHFDQRVEMDVRALARVDLEGGRWEWLSSSRPISFEHTPMLSLPWEYTADRNVLGKPIRVADATFERGVGVHSRSSLTYDLKGRYTQFVTSLGMDDDSGPYADVDVRVLVDGRPQFERQHVQRGSLFGPVRIDVTKANRLELIVDFGANGDIQDRFNWVEAALIR